MPMPPEPKCAKCKKMLDPQEHHMVMDYKPFCMKCARTMMDAKKSEMGLNEPTPVPAKDGNKGTRDAT